MPNTIAENQGAFIKKMGVSSTALASLELIHQVINAPKYANHIANIVLKLDLSKAFDKVKWSYTITIHQNCGFPPLFIN